MLVWVDPLLHREVALVLIWLIAGHDSKSLWLVGCHKLIKGGKQELGRVDEP